MSRKIICIRKDFVSPPPKKNLLEATTQKYKYELTMNAIP